MIPYNSNFFKKEYFCLKIKQFYLKFKYLKALKYITATFVNILNLVRRIINLAHSQKIMLI